MEVMQEVRRLRPDVPIIAVSGGGVMPKDFHLQNAQVHGAVAILRKPFELGDLLETVERTLAGDDLAGP